MGGRPVLNEDLVNLPNWLVLKLRIEGEDAIRLDERRAARLPARVRHPHTRLVDRASCASATARAARRRCTAGAS